MRINDYRHHAAEEPPNRKAAKLLEKLAERAATCLFYGNMADRTRHAQRNRSRMPDHFANRPGAFIQERCTPEERELLGHLTSEKTEPDQTWLRYFDNPVSPFAAPTNWKFKWTI